jgi:hypothetical protein
MVRQAGFPIGTVAVGPKAEALERLPGSARVGSARSPHCGVERTGETSADRYAELIGRVVAEIAADIGRGMPLEIARRNAGVDHLAPEHRALIDTMAANYGFAVARRWKAEETKRAREERQVP